MLSTGNSCEVQMEMVGYFESFGENVVNFGNFSETLSRTLKAAVFFSRVCQSVPNWQHFDLSHRNKFLS